mgnify:CR=1 FL=1
MRSAPTPAPCAGGPCESTGVGLLGSWEAINEYKSRPRGDSCSPLMLSVILPPQLFAGATTIRLSQPVPTHAFAWRWSGPASAARAATMPLARRRQLLTLTASSGVLENYMTAHAAAGDAGTRPLWGPSLGASGRCHWGLGGVGRGGRRRGAGGGRPEAGGRRREAEGRVREARGGRPEAGSRVRVAGGWMPDHTTVTRTWSRNLNENSMPLDCCQHAV